MAATRFTLVFLNIAFAGAVDRVTRASSVDAEGKVHLMPEALTAKATSADEVIRGTKESKLEAKGATLAQIKPAQSLAQIRETLTDRILEYLADDKGEVNAGQIFTDMKAHLEPLKEYSEAFPDVKAKDAIDTERLAAFIEKGGATKEHLQELRMLYGIEKLYEENGMSLSSKPFVPSWLKPEEKKQVELANDAITRIGMAVMGGHIEKILMDISKASTVCPICAQGIVYIGMSQMMWNMAKSFPLKSTIDTA